jgi:pimeloyl-ACP methyl ester carboxylesterase
MLDQSRLHIYQKKGTGQYHWVCVHGLGSSASSFAPFAQYLVPYAKTISIPDAPSHGLSDVHPSALSQEQLYQVWEMILLTLSKDHPIVLVGNSLGGAVSLKFALNHPDRIHKLVLCSPAGFQLSVKGIQWIQSQFKMTYFQDGQRFIRTLYHNEPPYSFLIGCAVRANLLEPKVQNFLTQLQPGMGLSPLELQKLKPSTLLIWGESEKILPAEGIKYFKTHLPSNVEYRHPPCFGHSPHLEWPKEFLTEILNWMSLDET